MSEFEDVAYLINDELIEITLKPYHVAFTLQDTIIQLGSEFAIWHFEQHVGNVSPGKRTGDIGLLWSAIGAKIHHVVWNSVISIEFDNKVKIVIPKTGQAFRGTLFGRHGDTNMIEDF